MSNRPNTRASNAEKHPGKIVLDSQQKHRSSKEVAAERKVIALRQEEQRLGQAATLRYLEEAQIQEIEAQSKVSADELTAAKPQALKRST